MQPWLILPSRFIAHPGDSFLQFTRIVSYLLVDQHTGPNLEELNLCFWVNLLLIVLLAAAQTGSAVSTEQFVAQLPPSPPSLTMDALLGQKGAASHLCKSNRDANIQKLTFQTKRRKSNSIKSFFPCSLSPPAPPAPASPKLDAPSLYAIICYT